MTTVDDRPAPEIGTARKRKEDRRLITGRTRWTDNIQLPGMLHLAMVRSPFAHARITAIDTGEAKAAPGVVAVVHRQGPRGQPGRQHQRLADHARPGHAHPPAGRRRPRRLRRRDRRRRRGPQRERRARRRRAGRRRLRRAAGRARPQGGRGRRRCSRTPTSAPTSRRFWKLDSAEAGTGGDVDEAIAKARADGIVIEREYRQQRLVPAFMEPRSIVVDPTSEQMTVWSATQVPHILRFAIAAPRWASPSPRCASSPPTSAVASAASCRSRPRSSRRSPSPASSAGRASSPRPARSR